MAGVEGVEINKILEKIIDKSLFTRRQVEIIINNRKNTKTKLAITSGAYYRQLGQSRKKLERVYYTVVLLHALGVMLPDDVNVMSDVFERINVVDSDKNTTYDVDKIMNVIDAVVKKIINI